LSGLTERLSGAISSIRNLAYDLLPPGLEDLGLVRTLARYCTDFANRSGLVVDFFADGMEGVRLSFETQINIYRLVQEALTNVRKHAQASRATVRIIRSYPSVIVRIEDDGQGVDLEQRQDEFYQAKKMGIWGMRERARLLGGRIALRSRPGRGMRIHIEIPQENMNNGA
jgi:signal transduction histidine kinase